MRLKRTVMEFNDGRPRIFRRPWCWARLGQAVSDGHQTMGLTPWTGNVSMVCPNNSWKSFRRSIRYCGALRDTITFLCDLIWTVSNAHLDLT